MNLTQIYFPNKLARMVLEYPDNENPVTSRQGPLEGVNAVPVQAYAGFKTLDQI